MFFFLSIDAFQRYNDDPPAATAHDDAATANAAAPTHDANANATASSGRRHGHAASAANASTANDAHAAAAAYAADAARGTTAPARLWTAAEDSNAGWTSRGNSNEKSLSLSCL